MSAIDFMTGLGRLLQDGSLRDRFAAEPGRVAAELGVSECDFSAFIGLRPVELERQSRVLLRKRFEQVRWLIPSTTERLAEAAWIEFQRYGRAGWPRGSRPHLRDAHDFCQHLRQSRPEVLCRLEWNRLCFALGQRRLLARWVRNRPQPLRGRAGLQILLRTRQGNAHELLLWLGL